MSSERYQYQIIRKDSRNAFVESLSDGFSIGKVHLVFAAYDLSKPAGQRQTNVISVYVDVAEWLELCRKFESGEMRGILKQKRETGDRTAILEWLGGTSAERLTALGKGRLDGMSVSRVAKLLCGSKTEFLFVADSGPGRQNEKGLIVPQFQRQPENHVTVSLTWEAMSELVLMTRAHYFAWLSARYMLDCERRPQS